MGVQNLRSAAYIVVSDTAPVVAFYTDVFEAVLLTSECLLDGRVLQAELSVGGHRLTVSEWAEDQPMPGGMEPTSVLSITPADPQLLLKRAMAAGAKLESAANDSSDVMLRDPAGQRWTVVGASRPE